MILTDEACDEFKQMFKDESNKTLAESEADDMIVTINDIKVAIACIINSNTQNLILDRSGNGKGTSMIGKNI